MVRELLRFLGPAPFLPILGRTDVRGTVRTLDAFRLLLTALLLHYPLLALGRAWKGRLLPREQGSECTPASAYGISTSSSPGTVGLAPSTATSYSLLFLVVFNVFGGLIGAVAQFVEPLR